MGRPDPPEATCHAFSGAIVWQALAQVPHVPEHEPLSLTRQWPWPEEDALNGPCDMDGDPACFSLVKRKAQAVCQLLDVTVWKASALWAGRWTACPDDRLARRQA
ncbi:MAG: hypothetical protein ACUVRO_05745 [Armatimonadota bacterium]